MRQVAGVVLTGCILIGFSVFAPPTDVRQVAGRLLPIMLFFASISVVVNLSARSGLFWQIAFASSSLSRGRNWILWLGIVILSLVSTAFLSLDTTAVLVTPLAMAVVAAARVNPLPYAFTVIWLANTASLLLPVSNLTNLLAMDVAGFGGTPGFARLALVPAAASVAATLVFTGVVFAKVLRGRHKPLGNRDLLVEGLSNEAIASKLENSSRTVAVHVQALLKRRSAGSRTELAAQELRRQLLTSD